jgi:hypothetical protein
VTRARLVAEALALLGPVDGPVAIVERGRVTGVRDGETAAATVCVFLGEPADAAARRVRLDAAAPRLVVVDHNLPRAWWRRAVGWAALVLRGVGPARAAYPVAREVRDRGFLVERLRLAAGERVQLVVARRR